MAARAALEGGGAAAASGGMSCTVFVHSWTGVCTWTSCIGAVAQFLRAHTTATGGALSPATA